MLAIHIPEGLVLFPFQGIVVTPGMLSHKQFYGQLEHMKKEWKAKMQSQYGMQAQVAVLLRVI